MFAFPLLAGPHGSCRGDTPSCARHLSQPASYTVNEF
jgi:hypothetical protein